MIGKKYVTNLKEKVMTDKQLNIFWIITLGIAFLIAVIVVFK